MNEHGEATSTWSKFPECFDIFFLLCNRLNGFFLPRYSCVHLRAFIKVDKDAHETALTNRIWTPPLVLEGIRSSKAGHKPPRTLPRPCGLILRLFKLLKKVRSGFLVWESKEHRPRRNVHSHKSRWGEWLFCCRSQDTSSDFKHYLQVPGAEISPETARFKPGPPQSQRPRQEGCEFKVSLNYTMHNKKFQSTV